MCPFIFWSLLEASTPVREQKIEYYELLFTPDKGNMLLEKAPLIYYESDYETALILARRTHVPTVAVDRMELLYQ